MKKTVLALILLLMAGAEARLLRRDFFCRGGDIDIGDLPFAFEEL